MRLGCQTLTWTRSSSSARDDFPSTLPRARVPREVVPHGQAFQAIQDCNMQDIEMRTLFPKVPSERIPAAEI